MAVPNTEGPEGYDWRFHARVVCSNSKGLRGGPHNLYSALRRG